MAILQHLPEEIHTTNLNAKICNHNKTRTIFWCGNFLARKKLESIIFPKSQYDNYNPEWYLKYLNDSKCNHAKQEPFYNVVISQQERKIWKYYISRIAILQFQPQVILSNRQNELAFDFWHVMTRISLYTSFRGISTYQLFWLELQKDYCDM